MNGIYLCSPLPDTINRSYVLRIQHWKVNCHKRFVVFYDRYKNTYGRLLSRKLL